MARIRTLVVVVVAWILLLRIMSPWAYGLLLVEINDIRVRSILIGIVALLATRLIAPHYLVAALTALALIVVDEMLPFPSPLDGWIAFDYLSAPVFYALAGVWGALAWQSRRTDNEELRNMSVESRQ
jgi:hypothetical protein